MSEEELKQHIFLNNTELKYIRRHKMTDKEKAIVMAYTGVVMLRGDKFRIFHNYVENLLNKPIWPHELAKLADEIREKSRCDFIKLCEESTRECDLGDYCISIQEAIEAMYKLEQDDIDLYGCKIPEGFDSKPAIEALKNLKPITPRLNIGRWM